MNAYQELYPRPQLRRDSFFSLCGEWELAFSRELSVPSEFPYTVTVPFPPESEASGVKAKRKRDELLYYRRTFTLPEGFVRSRTLLHFGAVDQVATVLLNGFPLGTHEGGYLPFSVDVGDHLIEGENVLVVAVRDTLDHTYPYGKQRERRGGMWYTPVSGIWQSVWMESYPEGGIYGIRAHANERCVHIEVESDAKLLYLAFRDGDKDVVYEFKNEVVIKPEHIRLWSPEDPYLYRFKVWSDTDKAESYFALRRLDARVTKDGRTRFFLNGKPYFLHGVLDQGYYPDGIYLPADPKEYERDIMRAKRLGFNMIRKHIKVESAIFYYLCDERGLIVCQDAVNNGTYSFLFHTALPTVGLKRFPDALIRKSRRARDFFEEHTKEMLDYLTHFPSVLMFTIFNEAWGQKDANALYHRFKKAYPSMLFDTASGWFKTAHTDMRSDHVYFKKIKPNYEKETLPVFLSEFGGYSLPVSGHTYPSGRNYGYALCRDGEDLTARLLRLYREEVIPAIRTGLGGAVITQLTDIEDETNGFYTYDRDIEKIPAEAFAALRGEMDAVMAEIEERE